MGMLASAVDKTVTIAAALRAAWVATKADLIKWHGCFADRPAERMLAGGSRAFGHTTQACAAACMGYALFALQGGGQCFCARTLSQTNH